MASFQFDENGKITAATITIPSTNGGPPVTLVIQNNYIPNSSSAYGDMLANGQFATYVHDLQGYVQQPEIASQLGGLVDEIQPSTVSTFGGGIDAPANTLVINVGSDISTESPSAGVTLPQYDQSAGELQQVTININTNNAQNAYIPTGLPSFPNQASGGLDPVYINNTTFKELGNVIALGNPTVAISVPNVDYVVAPNTPGGYTNPKQIFGNINAINSSLSGSHAVEEVLNHFAIVDQNFGKSLEGEDPRLETEHVGFHTGASHSLLSPNGIPDNSPVAVSNFMTGVENAFTTALNTISPLVLDLSSNGSGITLAAPNSSDSVYRDFGDGFKHDSGWVTGTTGLLCVDPTGTGVITQADLFGNNGTYANGFQALAAYDTNGDGVINASDTDFSQLRVWIPSAGTNGVSQPSDIYTLAQLGITSIDLNYTNENYQINGNNIEEQSTFVINGNTQTIADAWFAYDPTNTVYDGSYTPNPVAFELPDQRGYGQLPTLDISESLDPTLLSQVQNLAGQSFSQLLDPSFHLESTLESILFEWAGVTGVVANPNSPYFNSALNQQELSFLENLLGQQWGDGSGYVAIYESEALAETWNISFRYLAAHLLGQAGFANLMGNPVYDLTTDAFSANGSNYDVAVQFADQSVIGEPLQHLAANDIYVLEPGDAPMSSGSPGLVIEEIANGGGTNSLLLGTTPSATVMWDDYRGNLYVQFSPTDLVEITAATDSNGNTLIGQYMQQIVFEDGTVWNLTGGLELTATGTNQSIYGTTSGGDILIAASSSSGANLFASGGTETLVAGPGAVLYNGAGTDTDVFSAGAAPASNDDGVRIWANTSGGTAVIALHGIDPSAVTMFDDSYGRFFVQYSSTDQIVVENGSFSGATGFTLGSITGITFDDTNHTTWDLTGGLNLTATADWQVLYGTTGGGDTLTAAGSLDSLYAFGGAETLVAGPGATLYNGTGTDTDVFSAGAAPVSNDDGVRIWENTSGGTAVIAFHGIDPSAVTMSDNASGQFFINYSATDQIVAENASFNGATGFTLGSITGITFDDTNHTTWDLTGVVARRRRHTSISMALRTARISWRIPREVPSTGTARTTRSVSPAVPAPRRMAAIPSTRAFITAPTSSPFMAFPPAPSRFRTTRPATSFSTSEPIL
jgi:hypothetical protein